MVNKEKRKGTDWERHLVELFEENLDELDEVKRVAGSGAIGTIMQEPRLFGDVLLKIPGHHKEFRIEAKTGYGGSKQLAIKKEWLDKIAEEAGATFAIPLLAGKFLNAKSGVKYFIALDFYEFCGILNYVNELKDELDKLYERLSDIMGESEETV